MYCIVTVVRFVIILIKFYVCMYVCMYDPVRQCWPRQMVDRQKTDDAIATATMSVNRRFSPRLHKVIKIHQSDRKRPD